MKEDFFYTNQGEYELFMQATYFTPGYEIITIIRNGDIWKEDKNEFTTAQYNELRLAEKYEVINEARFAEAQNKVLEQINQSRQSLKKLYFDLWTDFLIAKVQIQEELVKSGIDFTNFHLASQFKEQMAIKIDLDAKRQKLSNAFSNNQAVIFSNEDIYGKVANERLDTYLNRRAQLLKKI